MVAPQPRTGSGEGSGLPSTRTSSLSLTSKAGVVELAPLTRTRPSTIQRSASRREHSPARAIALAMRNGSPGAAGALRRAPAAGFGGRLIARLARSRPVAGAFDGHGFSAWVRFGWASYDTARRLSHMARALAQAEAAGARGEVPIGAVVVGPRRGAARRRRQPNARTRRPNRARRASGDSRGVRGARLGAAHRLRPLRDAGAVRHVRRRHLVCPHPPALLTAPPIPRAAASSMGRAFSATRPVTTRRALRRSATRPAPPRCSSPSCRATRR